MGYINSVVPEALLYFRVSLGSAQTPSTIINTCWALWRNSCGFLSMFEGNDIWHSLLSVNILCEEIQHTPTIPESRVRIGIKRVCKFYHCMQHVLPPGKDTPWFDSNGIPLRWQTPLGVLYDLMTAKDEKPWALTVIYLTLIEQPYEKILCH